MNSTNPDSQAGRGVDVDDVNEDTPDPPTPAPHLIGCLPEQPTARAREVWAVGWREFFQDTWPW